MSTATMTSKGQVTIPKDVRDRLRLRQGDRLEFVVEDDGSVRMRRRSVDIWGVIGMIKTDRHVTVEEMNEAIRKAGAGS